MADFEERIGRFALVKGEALARIQAPPHIPGHESAGPFVAVARMHDNSGMCRSIRREKTSRQAWLRPAREHFHKHAHGSGDKRHPTK